MLQATLQLLKPPLPNPLLKLLLIATLDPAAQAAEALEAGPSQPSGNGAVGFDVQVTGRMARSYPLSAVVGQEDIKEVCSSPRKMPACVR